MSIYPYATLAEDATTQFDLHWLNEGSQGANTHTVEYRKKGSNDWLVVDSDIVGGLMTASSDKYFYWIRISNLESDVEYEARITEGSNQEVVEFKTFPRRLHRRTLKGISMQDVHIRRNVTGAWNNDLTKMDIISDENPEFIILAGDWITSGSITTSANANKQVDWVKNWLSRLDCNGRLVPIFYVPGNHEVGNGFWTGVKPAPLEDNVQCNEFCRNKQRFKPFNEYYGQIKIGNYINFIGLDTHSAYSEDQGEWLDENIDMDVPMSIAHYHNPILVAGVRSGDGSENIEQGLNSLFYWMPSFYKPKNLWVALSGNIHVRKATKKLKVSNTQESDSIELKDGSYLVEETNPNKKHYFVELGEGWTANKPTINFWHTQYTQANREHYYRIYIDKNSHRLEDVDITTPLLDVFNFGSKKVKFIKNKSVNMIGGI